MMGSTRLKDRIERECFTLTETKSAHPCVKYTSHIFMTISVRAGVPMVVTDQASPTVLAC